MATEPWRWRKALGGKLTLLGLVTLDDPPRPDAKQLIAKLKDLGVSVKMLTGDALPVANAIGQEVGLPCIQRMADFKVTSTHPKVEDLLSGVDKPRQKCFRRINTK